MHTTTPAPLRATPVGAAPVLPAPVLSAPVLGAPGSPEPQGARPLTTGQEGALARRRDAGVFAAAVLAGAATTGTGATREELAALVDDGRRACSELAQANRGLVWLVVNRVARRSGLDPEELGQEGFVGLLEAAARFDPARGCFATFALHWVRLRVGEAAVTGLGALGLGIKPARLWRQVRVTVARHVSETGREPAVEELARELGRPVAAIRDVLGHSVVGWSPLVDEAVPVPEERERPDVSVLLAPLDDMERAIVRHRFGLDATGHVRTYAQVAEVVGLSEATVRRRERAALERLRRRPVAA